MHSHPLQRKAQTSPAFHPKAQRNMFIGQVFWLTALCATVFPLRVIKTVTMIVAKVPKLALGAAYSYGDSAGLTHGLPF